MIETKRRPSPARVVPRLRSGDRLPVIRVQQPGPRTQQTLSAVARFEAPGINTLVGGERSLVWEEACGSNVLDPDGNLLLDFSSGFGAAAVGHRHPKVVAAVQNQAARLLHGLGDVHTHPARARLAAKLVELAPMPDAQVYFAVSGSDAIEIALKTALLATAKPGILVFDPAYHGLSLGALAATSRGLFRLPFAPHLHHHIVRLPFACPQQLVEDCLLMRELTIGAVLVEPIVGREGVIVPPSGWLRDLSEICLRKGVLLIADEIFTGFGRAGCWFVSSDEGVTPDLVCAGKALGGGLPIAAVIARRDLLAHWHTEGEALHSSTFVAHPLAMSAALAVLEIIESESLLSRATESGKRLEAGLRRKLGAEPAIREIRGKGLLWGIEVNSAALARTWSLQALSSGLIVLVGGSDGRVLELCPPLTTTTRQLDAAVEILAASYMNALVNH